MIYEVNHKQSLQGGLPGKQSWGARLRVATANFEIEMAAFSIENSTKKAAISIAIRITLRSVLVISPRVEVKKVLLADFWRRELPAIEPPVWPGLLPELVAQRQPPPDAESCTYLLWGRYLSEMGPKMVSKLMGV